MNWDEYNNLFHKLQLNLVAFQPLMHCDKEVLKLVNAAIEAEREACADMVLTLTCMGDAKECFEVAATYIRARGQE
jgi:hypothetical protein